MLTVCSATAAWADAKHPNPFLSQAKAFAQQGEGDKCLKRLLQAEQKWRYNDKKDKAEIELFGGICGYLVGETQAAEVSFKNAVKIDPKVALPSDLGPGIENIWVRATGKTAPPPTGAPPPPEKKDPNAGKPAVAAAKPVEKPAEAPPPPPPPMKSDAPVASRPLEPADAPNLRDDLTPKKGRAVAVPVVLGVAAVGAGAAGLVLGLQAKAHESQFKSPDTFQSDADKLGSQARTEALVTNVMFAAAGALAITAIAVLVFTGD